LTAPATTSYVCSALKPVIPDVSIRGYERPEMADCRPYLTIFEWRLFLLGLRYRPQLWSKENGTPSASNRR
jgi:hypothetical protein